MFNRANNFYDKYSFLFLSILLLTIINLPKSILCVHKMKQATKIMSFFLNAKTTYNPKLSLISKNKYFNIEPRSNENVSAYQLLSKRVTEYSGKVKIGNPPQELEMVFDTGSANIIVSSVLCNSTSCNKHKNYNMELSETHIPIYNLDKFNNDIIRFPNERDHVELNFGTGQVKSFLGYDNICIGKNNLCANKTIILEAYEMSTIPFSHVSFDGIIGLGFTYLSISEESNLIEMLYRQNKIHQRIFSFYFNKNDSLQSILNIGGFDQRLYQGEVHYAPVISANYWEIEIEGVFYENELIVDCTLKKCTGIVDTGTSMIAAPFESFEAIQKKINADFNCKDLNSLNSLKIQIKGKIYEIESSYYTLQLESDTGKNCVTALMQLDALSTKDKHTFILGLPFLKKYFSIYDREKKRIGFALANHKLQLN